VNALDASIDLGARRRRLGISQKRLAVAAECSESFVRLLENGYRPALSPTRERVERVLEELER
jgi:predicted transcriptional regulator